MGRSMALDKRALKSPVVRYATSVGLCMQLCGWFQFFRIDFVNSSTPSCTHAKPWCNVSFGPFVAGVASGSMFFFSSFLLHFSSCFNIVSYLCPNFLFSDCNLSFSFLRCSTSARKRSNSCDRFNLRSSFSDRRRSTSKRKLKDSLDIQAYSIHMPLISFL